MRRILLLTIALAACGALAGAVCGLLALAPIPILHVLHPTPDDGFVVASEFAFDAAAFGAAIGAVLGPALAWSLLRRVPLWRVVVEPTLGTVIGSFAGWALSRNPWLPGIGSLVVGAVLGALAAGIALRARAARYHLAAT